VNKKKRMRWYGAEKSFNLFSEFWIFVLCTNLKAKTKKILKTSFIAASAVVLDDGGYWTNLEMVGSLKICGR